MLDPDFVSLLRPHLKYLDAADELQPERQLKDLGLDSASSVELLFDLEDRYNTTLPDDELTEETFATPQTLWAAVCRASAASAP